MTNTGTLKVTTPSDREIVMTRVFDAPRSLVWDAMSKPELLQRWLLGPPGWTMEICENDLQIGGVFRHVWRGPDGAQMAMRGVYREIVSPERVVRTESFEIGCDSQSGEQLATAVLSERGGKTTLTITLLYPSKEARDATIASGMEHGAAASYDRLAELLTNHSRETPMAAKPKTFDECLAALSDDKRAALEKLRKTIKAAAPRAEECISYGLAAFRLEGKPLVALGASANHCAFYLMSGSTVEAHQDELAKYDTSKGTIRFPADKPLPAALVRKLVKARIAENAARGKSK